MKPQQLAINSISTKHDEDLAARLEAYAAAGFDKVEFCFPHATRGGLEAEAINALLDAGELQCIGGFETIVKSFGKPADIEANHAIHQRNAVLLDALGGGTIVAGTDGPGEGDRDDPLAALDRIGATCAKLAETWPDSVSLAIEFNWSPIVKSLRSAVRVCEAASHPRVGILFDPAHYHCTSTKFDDLTADSVAHIKHVHVNNMRPKPGEHSHCNTDRLLPRDAPVKTGG